MPNKKSGRSRSLKSLSDVTINDFANAAVCKNRQKKSTSNVIAKVLEEKSWDEKTAEDFDEEFLLADDLVKQRRRKKTFSECDTGAGNNYHIDVWFLISEYIRPEDVGRFAAICKTALEVVSSAKFWFSLYRRYYVSGTELPEELQPEQLVRKYGLKAAVIRSLYYTYTPFVNKLNSPRTPVTKLPYILTKRICYSQWQQSKGDWIYYFKMKQPNTLHSIRIESNQPDLLEILDDVLANSEENCCILRLACKDFILIPPVLGQVLTSVKLSLSGMFGMHKLQLDFGSGISNYSCADGTGNKTVILDPVTNYKVLDWWHPHYPHKHHLRNLLKRL